MTEFSNQKDMLKYLISKQIHSVNQRFIVDCRTPTEFLSNAKQTASAVNGLFELCRPVLSKTCVELSEKNQQELVNVAFENIGLGDEIGAYNIKVGSWLGSIVSELAKQGFFPAREDDYFLNVVGGPEDD